MYYSISSIRLYEECKGAYKLKKEIDRSQHLNNVFAQMGTFAHNIIEKYQNGEIFDPFKVYLRDFKKASYLPFPSFMQAQKEKFYLQGLEYFKDFYGYGNVEAVEKKLSGKINGVEFKGFADIIYRDQENSLILEDHKFKDKLKPAEKRDVLRQLYLYAELYAQETGEKVDKLRINLIRANEVVEHTPNEKDREKAFKTIFRTIQDIEQEKNFEFKEKPDFYCQAICNFRDICSLGG